MSQAAQELCDSYFIPSLSIRYVVFESLEGDCPEDILSFTMWVMRRFEKLPAAPCEM